MRHLIRVSVSIELLIVMMKKGFISQYPIECVEGLPDDAQFVGTCYDNKAMCVDFIFQHPSFPATENTQEIVRTIVMHRVNR